MYLACCRMNGTNARAPFKVCVFWSSGNQLHVIHAADPRPSVGKISDCETVHQKLEKQQKKKRAENSAFNHFLTLSSNLSTVMLANLGAKFDPRILVQVEKSACVTRDNFHGKWHFFWARLISYLPCKTSRRCNERSRRYS